MPRSHWHCRRKRRASTSWLCSFLLLQLSGLEPVAPHDTTSARSDITLEEALRQRQRHDDEQCLCGIPAYAYFYSRAFGRSSCSGFGMTSGRSAGSPLELQKPVSPGQRQLLGNSRSGRSTAAVEQLGTICIAGNRSGTVSSCRAADGAVALDVMYRNTAVQDHGTPAARNSASATLGLQAAPQGAPIHTPDSREPTATAASSAGGFSAPPRSASAPTHRTSVNADSNSKSDSQEPDQERLIVRFRHYAPAEEHRATLRVLLGPEGPTSWTWQPRNNAAARYPTDFALLTPAPGHQSTLQARLTVAAEAAAMGPAGAAASPGQRLGSGPGSGSAAGSGSGFGIRDVHPDKRYTGRLAWAPEGRLKDLVLDLSSSSTWTAGAAADTTATAVAGAAAAATPTETGPSSSSSSAFSTASASSSSSFAAAAAAADAGAAEAVFEGPDATVFAVSRGPGRMVTRFSTEDLDGDDDPEAMRERESQRVWREPGLRGGDRMGGADEEDGDGAYGGGGGLIGSRRRVAALPQQDEDIDQEGDDGDGATAGEPGAFAIGPGGGGVMRGSLPRHGTRTKMGRDAHHSDRRQRQQQQQERRSQKLRRQDGGGGADGVVGGSAAAAADNPGAVGMAHHAGRMGGHLNLNVDTDAGSAHGGGVVGRGKREEEEEEEEQGEGRRWRRRLQLAPHSGTVPVMLEAAKLWKLGFTGRGVRVGIFDTGIRADHPHIRNIRERTNWTHQKSLSDGLGHGSFVAGVVGGQDSQCPGFAPDVDMYTFKVFTDDQVSYTSWFLDAFNYAITVKVHVINLSIGGPDYLDQPFVDKVLEVTSNGILLISAIGNDGPLYGTLNNPADQNDVIGVGGIDNWDNIAGFSSRGMSTWELPRGYGRVKPDVMAYSKDVQGSKIQGGCRSLSGTSVASPVVAGAVCLLASTVPEGRRWELLNPAAMKQALVEGADRLSGLNIYEQGSGRINLPKSMAILQSYEPRASIIPASLDLTECPYMWPFCRQHLYAGALPVLFNATLLNGQGVVGRLEAPPRWRPADVGGRLLHMTFEWSETLWPWSGYLALYIRVRKSGASYNGVANGVVECTVVSPPDPGEDRPRRSLVRLPVRARIGPPPPRSKRLLWDQFHSLKYPPAYLPRDNLDIKSDILDWHGDHPHTNFHGLFNELRDRGYFLEVLGSPATCFDPEQYGGLLIVDSEEEWYPAEVAALEAAVAEKGLSLFVFADWYNVASLDQMRFFDDNTRSWWTPATGGANVPALNDLLAPYGIALGDAVIHGTTTLAGVRVVLNHGADIAKVPAGGWLHKASLDNAVRRSSAADFGLLGAVTHGSAGGTVVVFSDSNCLDRSHMTHNCYDLVLKLLARVLEGDKGTGVLDDAVKLKQPYLTTLYNFSMPERRPTSEYNFTAVSYVLQHPQPECFPNAACERRPDDPDCQTFVTDSITYDDDVQDLAGLLEPATKGAAHADASSTANAEAAAGLADGRAGAVLLVHPDGTAAAAAHRLGLTSLQLLVLGCLLFLALFLALWVMRMAPGRGFSSGGGPSGGANGGGGGGGGNGGSARRGGIGSVRLRLNDV